MTAIITHLDFRRLFALLTRNRQLAGLRMDALTIIIKLRSPDTIRLDFYERWLRQCKTFRHLAGLKKTYVVDFHRTSEPVRHTAISGEVFGSRAAHGIMRRLSAEVRRELMASDESRAVWRAMLEACVECMVDEGKTARIEQLKREEKLAYARVNWKRYAYMT